MLLLEKILAQVLGLTLSAAVACTPVQEYVPQTEQPSLGEETEPCPCTEAHTLPRTEDQSLLHFYYDGSACSLDLPIQLTVHIDPEVPNFNQVAYFFAHQVARCSAMVEQELGGRMPPLDAGLHLYAYQSTHEGEAGSFSVGDGTLRFYLGTMSREENGPVWESFDPTKKEHDVCFAGDVFHEVIHLMSWGTAHNSSARTGDVFQCMLLEGQAHYGERSSRPISPRISKAVLLGEITGSTPISLQYSAEAAPLELRLEPDPVFAGIIQIHLTDGTIVPLSHERPCFINPRSYPEELAAGYTCFFQEERGDLSPNTLLVTSRRFIKTDEYCTEEGRHFESIEHLGHGIAVPFREHYGDIFTRFLSYEDMLDNEGNVDHYLAGACWLDLLSQEINRDIRPIFNTLMYRVAEEIQRGERRCDERSAAFGMYLLEVFPLFQEHLGIPAERAEELFTLVTAGRAIPLSIPVLPFCEPFYTAKSGSFPPPVEAYRQGRVNACPGADDILLR